MSGEAFMDLLRARVAPRTVVFMKGNGGDRGVEVTLSDGARIKVMRQDVRDIASEQEAQTYMDRVL